MAKLAALGAVSGLLLFLSDYPVHAWPLQLVALAPILWGLIRLARSPWAAAAAGGVLGLAYTVPTVVALEFPRVLGGVLALYVSVLWVLLVAGAYHTMRWVPPLGALATGALASVVEWADCTLLPVWGTAQAFVRVWTAAPWAVQFAALTGVTGIVFVVVSTQALAVSALTAASRRRTSAALLGGLLCAVAVFNASWWSRSPRGIVRVAAMGWTNDHLPQRGRTARAVLERLVRPLLRQAAAQGAELVVTPEVGLWMRRAERAWLVAALGTLAREQGVWLAAGWFDVERNDNRIGFFDPNGALRGEYVKTHLIQGVENYRAGAGRLVILSTGTVRLGGMICQDDNFTDLSRAYGRRGVEVLAVPTNDWRQVKDHHLENSLFRSIESGYGVVRAASNGVSAIASARGELLASSDHFADGPGVIVADVPLRTGGTPYNRLGEWWSLCCAVALLALSLADQRRQRPRVTRPS